MTALLDFPVPLSLLALGAFNLWAFARFARRDARAGSKIACRRTTSTALRALQLTLSRLSALCRSAGSADRLK